MKDVGGRRQDSRIRGSKDPKYSDSSLGHYPREGYPYGSLCHAEYRSTIREVVCVLYSARSGRCGLCAGTGGVPEDSPVAEKKALTFESIDLKKLK
ncbi:MAG: hypothetical protein ACE5MK_06635 [Acidobacteriota bacterium]